MSHAEADGDWELSAADSQQQHPHQHQAQETEATMDDMEYEVVHEQEGEEEEEDAPSTTGADVVATREEESKEAEDSPPPTALASGHARHRPHHTPAPSSSNRPLTALSSGAVAFDVSSLDAAAHAAIESDDEVVVAQFLQLLEQHREECERKSMYVEAELAKKKIEEMREHADSRLRSSMSIRHLSERVSLEEAHILEFDEFNAVWEGEILRAFDEATQTKQQTMLLRHVDALEAWTAAEQDRHMLRPKLSKQLLGLRGMQAQLARTRDYAQAERVRLQADALEAVELESLRAQWSQAVESRRAKFLSAQRAELDGYLARRAEDRRKLDLRRVSELRSTIVQKFKNLKSDLELAHAKERARVAKMSELGVAASEVLRHQAPRNRSYPSTVTPTAAESGLTPRRAPPPNAYGRTRAHSTALRQRCVEDEEEAMLRAGEALAQEEEGRTTPGSTSAASDIPTISGAMTSRTPTSARTHSRPGSVTARSERPRSSARGGAAVPTPPSSAQLIARQAQRPATSHAYDPTGHRPVVSRTPKVIYAAIHYSRPPPRAGTSRDRARELETILTGGNPPPPSSPPPPPPQPLSTLQPTPSPRSASYIDRINSRMTTAQKASMFVPRAALPSLAQTRAIEAQRAALAEERRQRAAAAAVNKHAHSSRSISSEDDF